MSGDNDNRLVGTWKLLSASSATTAGQENPYGLNPVGFLTYTGDGRVTALISYDGRKRLSALSVGGGPQAVPEEQAEAFRTFLAYAGRYTLNGDKVIHHMEISSIQNWVGEDAIRTVRFEGDRIVLKTPITVVNGKLQRVELVWQRLTPCP